MVVEFKPATSDHLSSFIPHIAVPNFVESLEGGWAGWAGRQLGRRSGNWAIGQLGWRVCCCPSALVSTRSSSSGHLPCPRLAAAFMPALHLPLCCPADPTDIQALSSFYFGVIKPSPKQQQQQHWQLAKAGGAGKPNSAGGSSSSNSGVLSPPLSPTPAPGDISARVGQRCLSSCRRWCSCSRPSLPFRSGPPLHGSSLPQSS